MRALAGKKTDKRLILNRYDPGAALICTHPGPDFQSPE
jgi:hypothetical protein